MLIKNKILSHQNYNNILINSVVVLYLIELKFLIYLGNLLLFHSASHDISPI